MAAPDLARIQSWMQDCIVNAQPDEVAIAATARELVLPSKTLSAPERLDIYRGMYLERMREALEIDYPALRHFLGSDAFHTLVAQYVEVSPSRSYTLNRLGDGLPQFIAEKHDLRRRNFLHDLARLELALTQAFDARETPSVSAEAIALVPPDAWETATMQPVAALQVLAFDYPVSAYVGAVLAEEPVPHTRKKKTWVAISRKNYNLSRLDLTRPAYELLVALTSGRQVGEAISSFPDLEEEQLFGWFRDWMTAGLFQAVRTAD